LDLFGFEVALYQLGASIPEHAAVPRPSLLSPSPPFPTTYPVPFPGALPLNPQLGVWEIAVSSPSGVWASVDFGAFWAWKTHFDFRNKLEMPNYEAVEG